MTTRETTNMSSTEEKAENLSPWHQFGKFNLAYLVPVNTVIALLTTISSIVLDFLSPKWRVLPALATASVVLFFLALLLYKSGLFRKLAALQWFNRMVQPVNGPAFRIPLIGFTAITAGLFSVAAMASTKSAKDGGFLAGQFDFVKDLQVQFGLVHERLDAIELKQDKLLGKQDEMDDKQDKVLHEIEALSKKFDALKKDRQQNDADIRKVVPDPSTNRNTETTRSEVVRPPDERRTSSPELAGKPVWKAGDQWVFRSTSSLQGVRPSTTNIIKKVTESNQQTKTLETAYGSTAISQVFDNDLKILTEHTVERGGVTYNKSYSEQPYFLKYPLHTGKTWKESYTKTTIGYQSVEYSIQSQVRGWTTVEVPAGTFRAIRIDTVKTNLTSGITENIASWYSPEVAQMVRVQSNLIEQGRLMKSSEELISHNHQ